MEDELMHDLSAGYALDALTPEEERVFEEHLARCSRCQADVAAFSETAASLAFAVPAATPPRELRARITAAVQADRATVVPLRPRWARPLAAAAAVAACAAVGLGVWDVQLHSELNGAAALHALPLRGAKGSVVVAGNHQATLVVTGLPRAPAGKTYEVWVMRAGGASPAGLFPGSRGTTTVHLSRPVPAGAQVGVTLEPANGSPQPTSKPLLTSAPL